MADDTPPHLTTDSFTNFAARLGIGQENVSTSSTYSFNPISRDRTKLEWMYRGTWLARIAVDSVADDMTRAGVTLQTDLDPDKIEELQEAIGELCIWERLNETIKWGRLYGGALAVMLIDGQDPATPLRIDAVGPGQFKGILVLDRHMVQPDLQNLVKEYGPDLGMPTIYEIVADAPALPRMKIHYTRCIRIDGPALPYYQRMSENLWGASIIEVLYDRMVAYDSATTGAAQLTYKAHLRTMKVEGLRQLIATGGKAFEALLQQIRMISLYQSNEGITLLDKEDEFEVHQYAFSGLSDVLMQFAEQLSGAMQIPLVRLLGQSPSGLNSSGESDLRTYYDGIAAQQSRMLRRGMRRLLDIMCRSVLDIPMPKGFAFKFVPLWQLSDAEKATIASQDTASIVGAFDAGVIGRQTALKELRQLSEISGRYSNITDEEIDTAEVDPPDPSEMMPGMPGQEAEPGEDGPPALETEDPAEAPAP